MLEYKRERLEVSEESHSLARELTEAINAFMNEEKGDELRESLDVGMAVGRMLMGGGGRQAAMTNMVLALNAAGMNALIAKVIEKEETPE